MPAKKTAYRAVKFKPGKDLQGKLKSKPKAKLRVKRLR